MKQKEQIYREILFQVIEKNNRTLTQAYIAKALGLSLSVVNTAIKELVRMNAVIVKLRSFLVTDPKKILYYWASLRNLEKDIIYQTRVELPVKEMEKSMPDTVLFTAYSGYKFRFRDVPADYSEVFVYAKEEDTKELQKRFPKNDNISNLFVLKKDDNMNQYGKHLPSAQLFVDLWNIKAWYAKDFLTALEAKYHGILE